MSNEQNPQEPYVEPRGPEFGGHGYVDETPAAQPPPPPPSTPVPAPYGTPHSYGSPPAYGPVDPYLTPYQPPAAAPTPVLAPMQQPYATQYPPQPYLPQPTYVHPYQMQLPEHPSSTTVLVLAIFGVFFPLLSPFAWYLGSKAKREVAAGAPYRWGGTGQVGYVLGLVYSLFMLVMIGFAFFMIMGLRSF